MIKAVIFDLYGTLLNLPSDSRPFLRLIERQSQIDAKSAVSVAMTRPLSLEQFASAIELSSQSDIATLEADLQADLRAVELFSDAIPTLTRLKSLGFRTAVISNLAVPYKVPFEQQGLSPLIDVTLFSCDCGMLKPNPSIYRLALDRLKAGPAKLGWLVTVFGAMSMARVTSELQAFTWNEAKIPPSPTSAFPLWMTSSILHFDFLNRQLCRPLARFLAA